MNRLARLLGGNLVQVKNQIAPGFVLFDVVALARAWRTSHQDHPARWSWDPRNARGCHRLERGLSVMAALTQRLPVGLIPEQLLVTTVRLDVVHNLGGDHEAVSFTANAKGVMPEESFTALSPAGTVIKPGPSLGRVLDPKAGSLVKRVTQRFCPR